MKGRKLSLEEVLNLEDGSKVWVEDEPFSKEGYLLYDTIDFYRLEACKFENTFFTDGYFVSTIGEVSSKTLKRYIENQG